MSEQQPKALKLAEWIEEDMSCNGDAEIAAELRRLHESEKGLVRRAEEFIDAYNAVVDFSDVHSIKGLVTATRNLRAAIAKATKGEA